MTETNNEAAEVVATPTDLFNTDNWKTEPTVIQSTDPAITEKDEHIKEEKPTSDKPNEPEKIPGASPKPIQDRPDGEKEDIKPLDAASFPALTFANEESEKVFNLLKEGKTEDVLSILSEQKKLKEVDKLPAADIIKLNLQYQNKDFTREDVESEFNDKYGMPDKPEQRLDETYNEFEDRTKSYEKEVSKIEARIARDAKPATKELIALSKEIVLPDIKPEAKVYEPTQEELAANKATAERYLQTVEESLKSFNGYESTFKDEEVELKVGYKLTKEEKAEIQPLIALAGMDAGAFFRGLKWIDDNGNINTTKLAEDLPLILNKQKVFDKLASETGNKRHEASVKSIKNISDYTGGNKGQGSLEPSNEEKQKNFANHFFSN